MSETIPPQAQDPADIAAIRAGLIGDRYSIQQIATALNVCERSVYAATAQIPHVKVFGKRYFDLEDVRRALARERNAASRGRGRPRKNATS